jgi:hypothetical protein
MSRLLFEKLMVAQKIRIFLEAVFISLVAKVHYLAIKVTDFLVA